MQEQTLAMLFLLPAILMVVRGNVPDAWSWRSRNQSEHAAGMLLDVQNFCAKLTAELQIINGDSSVWVLIGGEGILDVRQEVKGVGG
eukprot:13475888-Ditylum_brightwellii.AAC.1